MTFPGLNNTRQSEPGVCKVGQVWLAVTLGLVTTKTIGNIVYSLPENWKCISILTITIAWTFKWGQEVFNTPPFLQILEDKKVLLYQIVCDRKKYKPYNWYEYDCLDLSVPMMKVTDFSILCKNLRNELMKHEILLDLTCYAQPRCPWPLLCFLCEAQAWKKKGEKTLHPPLLWTLFLPRFRTGTKSSVLWLKWLNY